MAIHPSDIKETNQGEPLDFAPKQEHRIENTNGTSKHWSAGFLHRLSRNFRLALTLSAGSMFIMPRSTNAQEAEEESPEPRGAPDYFYTEEFETKGSPTRKVSFLQIQDAIDGDNYGTAARSMDKILKEYSFRDAAVYVIALYIYNHAKQTQKSPNICEAGARESDENTNEEAFSDLLRDCADILLEMKYYEKGIKFLLANYSSYWKSNDKQTIFEKIVLNEDDAYNLAIALKGLGKKEEASDFLVLFLKRNPGYIKQANRERAGTTNRFYLLAVELTRDQKSQSAYKYWIERGRQEREREDNERQRTEKIDRLARAIAPWVIIAGLLMRHEYNKAVEAE